MTSNEMKKIFEVTPARTLINGVPYVPVEYVIKIVEMGNDYVPEETEENEG